MHAANKNQDTQEVHRIGVIGLEGGDLPIRNPAG
jgi:hypothetical protein